MEKPENPANCSVPEHVLVTVLVNEVLLKIDPIGVFGDTLQYSEYLPEVPYLVDMVVGDRITTDGIREIFDHFFGSGRISNFNVELIYEELVNARELWLLNVERSASKNPWRRAACKAFAQAWLNNCGRTYCTCVQCLDLVRMMPGLGITYTESSGEDAPTQLEFLDLAELWTGEIRPDANARRDVFMFLNPLREFNCLDNANILEGWSEIPETVGQVYHQGNWRTRLREIEDLESTHFFRKITIQDFIEALALAAFTDAYFDSVN